MFTNTQFKSNGGCIVRITADACQAAQRFQTKPRIITARIAIPFLTACHVPSR